jgi:hypothetical protein
MLEIIPDGSYKPGTGCIEARAPDFGGDHVFEIHNSK